MNPILATLTLTSALAAATLALAGPIESLRGDPDLTATSNAPEKYRVEVIQGGFERSFREQPPMIPHGIEKYRIDLRQNGCLNCHSPITAANANAKPVPDSHRLDRAGHKLDTLSSRRYFCTQCHSVQMGGAPLVENVFEGRQ